VRYELHQERSPSEPTDAGPAGLRRASRLSPILAAVLAGLIMAWAQGHTEPSWASPHQNALRGTINTPVPSPTPGPTSTPSPTVVPGVTRVILQETGGEDVTQDTWLYAYIPRLPSALSGGLELTGGEVKSVLIRFGLAGVLPAGALVQAAELLLYVEIPPFNVAHVVDVGAFRVLRPWDEAQASWRYTNAATETAWSVEGCNGAGSDRAADADDTITLVHRAVLRGWDVTESVRYWVANPDENYGWLFKAVSASTASFSFASSRNSVVARRPILRIDYVVGDASPTPTATATGSVTPGATATATPSPTPSPTMGPGIRVLVYEDANRNQLQDPGEDGLPGMTVDLLNNGGALLQSRVTGADGALAWEGLSDGCYRVKQRVPWGYRASTPTELRICVGGSVEKVSFGNYAIGAIALPFVASRAAP